jgi:CBS domain-containing protein
MNVASICGKNVVTIRGFEELGAAAQLMREKHIGYLVVVEPDVASAGSLKPIGVLTDRDIVISVVARETDPRTLRVSDVMTQNPVVTRDSDSLEQALARMRAIGVRRLPVVGSRGELVGVLSLDEIIDSLAAALQNVAGSIRNERRIETALRP